MTKILTKSKEATVKARSMKRPQVLRGTRLSYNAGDRIRYDRSLRDLTRVMITETRRRVTKLFDGETAETFMRQQKRAAMDESITSKAAKLMDVLTAKFSLLFNNKSVSFAEQLVANADKTSKSALHASLKELSGGLSLKTGIVPPGMETISQAIIEENVALIKSIPEQYLNNVAGAVMRSITTGQGMLDLEPELKKYSSQSERRVQLLALDQTRKAYNAINKQRMQAIGIKKFEWVHSGGGQHPRVSHMRMSGKIYSFDDLPVINEEQVTRGYESPQHGIPGQAINCGCTMVPVIEFEDGEKN